MTDKYMLSRNFSRILFQYKNAHFKTLYIFLGIILVISIIGSFSAFHSNEASPYTSNGGFNLFSILWLLFPFISILSFFDLFSGLKENRVMKKILSEPITWKEIYLGSLLFIIIYSLLLTVFMIIPESIISYLLASHSSLYLFLKSMWICIPLFLYTVFWGLLASIFSGFSISDSVSITISILAFFSWVLFYLKLFLQL